MDLHKQKIFWGLGVHSSLNAQYERVFSGESRQSEDHCGDGGAAELHNIISERETLHWWKMLFKDHFQQLPQQQFFKDSSYDMASAYG